MPKKAGPKQKEQSTNNLSKSLGLFDHIKHIQYTQDPNYFSTLSAEDKKSFNLFMILRGLSMNPSFVEYSAYLYRYLEIIPVEQFYKILIELYPRHQYKEFYKWIKSSKDKDDAEAKKESKLTDILSQKYELSKKESRDYVRVYRSNKEGKKALFDLVRGFGLDDEETNKLVETKK